VLLSEVVAMLVEVRDGTVRERKVLVRGRESVFREQDGWVQLNGETRRIRVPLGRELAGYAPGRYLMDEASFGVNQWGDLVVSRLLLKAVAATAAGAAKAG
jgi:hypothetical protein